MSINQFALNAIPYVATIVVLFVGHAFLAVRKFPINYAQWRSFRTHMGHMKHEDTTLWFWQVVTGFALFFLATIHLYVMLMQRVAAPQKRGAVNL